jgi:hypothetical protein
MGQTAVGAWQRWRTTNGGGAETGRLNHAVLHADLAQAISINGSIGCPDKTKE